MPDHERGNPDAITQASTTSDTTDVTEPQTSSGTSTDVALNHGQALTADETRSITVDKRAQLVVVAGDADSGKTTLLTTIFEMFRKGPFAGFTFGGSRTLPGFEQRCHEARIASGRTTPRTERTKTGTATTYMHLRLSDVEKHGKVDLLLTDLSGEMFERARDSTDFCQQLEFLKRADRVVLLLDGDRILQLDKRQSATASSMQLLRSMLDAAMLNQYAAVDVLVSKRDLIEANNSATVRTTDAFIEQSHDRVRSIVNGRIGETFFGSIASRPSVKGTLPFAWGVDDALSRWMEPTFVPSYSERLSLTVGKRSYDRFGTARPS